MTDRTRPSRLELKAVDVSQRQIEAYAATFHLDRQHDRIQPGAFAKSIASKSLSDIAVLVGHRSEMLPVGRPLQIVEDQHGLFTRTAVFNTTAGDDLLATARELLAAGGSLGLSIGYRADDYAWATEGGKTVRLLKTVDLQEYSFLSSPSAAANPAALVTAVKRDAPLTMEQMRAELDDIDKWLWQQKVREHDDGRARRLQAQEALAELDAYLEPTRSPEDQERLRLLEQRKMEYRVARWAALGYPASLKLEDIAVPEEVLLALLPRSEVPAEDSESAGRSRAGWAPFGIYGH